MVVRICFGVLIVWAITMAVTVDGRMWWLAATEIGCLLISEMDRKGIRP
jgi:hypothetical protein